MRDERKGRGGSNLCCDWSEKGWVFSIRVVFLRRSCEGKQVFNRWLFTLSHPSSFLIGSHHHSVSYQDAGGWHCRSVAV